MLITITLTLPRDAVTLPVVRHLCRNALGEVGVTADCMADIELALSEACSNVLDHAMVNDEYHVEVDIGEDTCWLRIVDEGHGFDFDEKPKDPRVIDLTSERGRGLGLMHALVDRLSFTRREGDGMVVELEKRLEFGPAALLPALRRPV